MQTKMQSILETLTDIAIGFVVNLGVNSVVLPLFGLPVTFGKSLGITMCFTVIAIVRRYIVRRWFNRKEKRR